jgi:hypothetical protein
MAYVEGSGTTARLPLAAWNTRYVPSVADGLIHSSPEFVNVP